MRVIALVLTCLASGGQGRNPPMASEQRQGGVLQQLELRQSSGRELLFTPIKVLGSLLLAVQDPAAGWQVHAHRWTPSHNLVKYPIGNHAGVRSMVSMGGNADSSDRASSESFLDKGVQTRRTALEHATSLAAAATAASLSFAHHLPAVAEEDEMAVLQKKLAELQAQQALQKKLAELQAEQNKLVELQRTYAAQRDTAAAAPAAPVMEAPATVAAPVAPAPVVAVTEAPATLAAPAPPAPVVAVTEAPATLAAPAPPAPVAVVTQAPATMAPVTPAPERLAPAPAPAAAVMGAPAPDAPANTSAPAKRKLSAYDFKLVFRNEVEPLSKFLGSKASIIVNIKFDDPFTGTQIPELIRLYNIYGKDGFHVLAFSTNQGQAEPDENDDLRFKFKNSYNFGKFPLGTIFDKVDLIGGRQIPLYKWLTKVMPNPWGVQRVVFNYEKFLINAEGQPVRRYPRKYPVEMMEADIRAVMEGRELPPPTKRFEDDWEKAKREASKSEYAFRPGYNYFQTGSPGDSGAYFGR